MMFKAALFDLDGVVFDTEPQYTDFWGGAAKKYFPEEKDFASRVKGSTLTQMFDTYCPNDLELQAKLVDELNRFESQMRFPYVPHFEEFLSCLTEKGFKTAVVTSSNQAKMANVYRSRPDFKAKFSLILTSEDFAQSKPAPDCYLLAAQRLGVSTDECIGFEDSINGLKSLNAAHIFTVGLATTNPQSVVKRYADIVINDYADFNQWLPQLLERD